MIICYEGTPGSGKSYDAVKKIIDNLVRGRKVYTNIDGMGDSAKREYIVKVTGLDDLTVSLNLKYWDRMDPCIPHFWDFIEEGSLIVLDEAQNYFSNRDWQSEKNKGFCKWASTHRHFGFDVVLITQDIERIDAAVRALVEWTYRYRKVNFFGAAVKNKYIVYAYAGESSGKYLSKHIRTYDHRIFFCYESYVSKDIKELKVMTHSNVLKHPIFYAIPVMVIIFVFFFMKSGFSKGEIIPGSLHAKELADRTKQAFKPVPSVLPSRKANVVEFRDLEKIKSLKRASAEVQNMAAVEVPIEVKNKVGSVVIYEGDNIISAQDVYSKKMGNRDAGGSAIAPAPRIPVPFIPANGMNRK